MARIGRNERHANARRVLRWIRAHNKTEVSLKDVRRDALNQSLDADQTQGLLDGLKRARWLRETNAPTGGRPIRRWEVNPKLFSNAESAGSAGSALGATLSYLSWAMAGGWQSPTGRRAERYREGRRNRRFFSEGCGREGSEGATSCTSCIFCTGDHGPRR